MGSINILKPLSIFLYAAPLINLRNIDSFLRQIFLVGIDLGQLGPEASMLTTVHH